MAYRKTGLVAFVGVLIAGCGPAKLLPYPARWPRELDGRKLYHTAQGLIYATNPAAAGWMDRYLQVRLPRVEQQFGVKLARGAIIVISPGDGPMRGIEPWLSCDMDYLPRIYLPQISATQVGLPEAAWACALPTDDFYHKVVDRWHWRFFRETCANLSIFTSGPVYIPLLARQRRLYLAQSDVLREQALASAAVESCQLPEAEREALARKVGDFYKQEYARASKRYAVPD